MSSADRNLFSPDAMRTQAQVLMTLSEDLDGEADKMIEIINGLEGNRNGQEYKTFLDKYDVFKEEQEKFIDAVKVFGKYVADNAEEVD